jgi:hypothetical protein
MALMAFVAPYIYNVDTLSLKTKKLRKTNLGSHVYFGDYVEPLHCIKELSFFVEPKLKRTTNLIAPIQAPSPSSLVPVFRTLHDIKW